MMYWWARNYSLTDAAEEAEINAGTAVDVFQWFREVCSTKLLQTPLVLGGAGVVVQIDESLFRHKPKVQVSFVTAVVWEVTTIISRRTYVRMRTSPAFINSLPSTID